LIVHCKCFAGDYEDSIVHCKCFAGDYEDSIVPCKGFTGGLQGRGEEVPGGSAVQRLRVNYLRISSYCYKKGVFIKNESF
jgi:hypothetical protein